MTAEIIDRKPKGQARRRHAARACWSSLIKHSKTHYTMKHAGLFVSSFVIIFRLNRIAHKIRRGDLGWKRVSSAYMRA